MRAVALLLAVCLSGVALSGCSLFGFFQAPCDARTAARDLVSGKTYPNLLVEIDSPPGYGPNAEALEHLKTTLREVTGKKDIRVDTSDTSVPASTKKYTIREIAALAQSHRDHRTSSDTAVLHVLYVAGGSDEDDPKEGTKVLGVHYDCASIALYKGNIRESSDNGIVGTKPYERYVERAVLIHEFGHAAGLVNLGAPMVRPHEDPGHKGHSNNEDSVMYWAIERRLDLVDLVDRGRAIPWQFDADDKADLKALREA